MTLTIPSTIKPETLDPEERLFLHRTKREWGVGLWVAEERTRRRLRFEDGEQRAFKKGHYDLLERVDPDEVDVDAVFERLASEHDQVVAEKKASKARKDKPPVMRFTDQLMVFAATYPGGFTGDDYRAAARGTDEGRAKKAHVDPHIARARELLAEERMTASLRAGASDAVVDDAIAILKGASLVPPAKGHELLTGLDEDGRQAFAEALHALLWGEGRYADRFSAWMKTLRTECGMAPGWGLATVFPALVFPDDHLCVKRRAVNLQARSVKPGVSLPKRPNALGYRRARRIARTTRKRLLEADLEPADMFDVRRFMWDTLRPKAQDMLEELQQPAVVQQAA